MSAALLVAACGAPVSEKAPKDAPRGPVLSQYVAHQEEKFGVPSFVWIEPGAPPAAGTRAEDAARQVLKALAPTYKLTPDALAATSLYQLHDTGRGTIIARFSQQVGGQDVFRLSLSIALNRKLQPIAASGYLAPSVRLRSQRFVLDQAAAVAAALAAMADIKESPSAIQHRRAVPSRYPQDAGQVPGAREDDAPLAQTAPARVRKTYFADSIGLVPAYYLELTLARGVQLTSEQHSFIISASDGRVLMKNSQTFGDAFTYRVWADDNSNGAGYSPWDGPQGTAFTPYPIADSDGRQLTYVPSQLVTLQNAPFSKNDPWLPAGATTTSGNNANAYADIATPDGLSAGDIQPDITAGKLDFSYDPAAQDPDETPETRKAVTTQLFYTVNYLHDLYYDAGFDESAGNAQQDNFGRGGIGGDPVLAESEDSSFVNSFATSVPADGKSPKMQLQIWDRPFYLGFPNGVGGAAFTYAINRAGFPPRVYDVTADAVLVDDGAGTTSDGCETPFVNAAAVAGKIAVIDRGLCPFVQKAQNAQNNGAVGVMLVNNVAQSAPFMPGPPTIRMTTPIQSIDLDTGNRVKAQLASGSAVKVKMTGGAYGRDPSLEGGLVSHEWGHILSNRLVGNANGFATLQSGGLNEGWSDFIALLTLVRSEDIKVAANANWAGTYAIAGAYANDLAGNNAPYVGLRRYPYSTDLTKNPLTFKHIQDSEALPAAPAPSTQFSSANNSESHNAGEVWASLLWECYAALLRDTTRHTFEETSKNMRDYLVASLKLTPIDPTFLEARDALLASIYASDPEDFLLCAQGFANRGAGIGAIGPERDSSDLSPVTESPNLGADFQVVSVKLDDSVRSCDQDGILDNNETGLLTVTLRNTGTVPLTATGTVAIDNPNLIPGGETLSFPTVPPYATTTATTQVKMRDAQLQTFFEVSLELDAANKAVPGTVTYKRTLGGNYDLNATGSAVDSMDDKGSAWSVSQDTTIGPSRGWQHNDTQGRWSIPDNRRPSDNYLVSPPLTVAADGNFGFTLIHRYQFEADATKNFDGAVIELSADDGATWTDTGAALVNNGYTGQLVATNAPLSLRQAFTGASDGYPGFASTTADFGAAYQGKSVRLRLRVGTDQFTGAAGWDLDSIAFTGLASPPFPMRQPNPGTCKNTPPVTTVGEDQAVSPETLVTLTGQVSDADGDELTYRWVQASGPMIVLNNADTLTPTFTAPPVGESTELTFTLIANDKFADSEPATAKVVVSDTTMPEPGEADPNAGCSCKVPPRPNETRGAVLLFLLVTALLMPGRRKQSEA